MMLAVYAGQGAFSGSATIVEFALETVAVVAQVLVRLTASRGGTLMPVTASSGQSVGPVQQT